MKTTLKLEEIAQVALFGYLFHTTGIGWGWFAALFLAPDLSILAYWAGPKWGALAYNMAHHKGIGIVVVSTGLLLAIPWLAAAGWLLLAHSAFDRALGYGLKYPDAFKHTHLGTIGIEKQKQCVEATR